MNVDEAIERLRADGWTVTHDPAPNLPPRSGDIATTKWDTTTALFVDVVDKKLARTVPPFTDGPDWTALTAAWINPDNLRVALRRTHGKWRDCRPERTTSD